MLSTLYEKLCAFDNIIIELILTMLITDLKINWRCLFEKG